MDWSARSASCDASVTIDQRGALVQVGADDASLDGVAANREERHTSTVDAPLVDDHRLELARDARLEDAVVHLLGNADTVVDHGERAPVTFSAGRDEDASRMGVAGVAQQLDDDVFDAADVVLGLSALGLRDLESDVAVAEVLFDLEEGVARDGRHEVEEFIRRSHGDSLQAVPVLGRPESYGWRRTSR